MTKTESADLIVQVLLIVMPELLTACKAMRDLALLDTDDLPVDAKQQFAAANVAIAKAERAVSQICELDAGDRS